MEYIELVIKIPEEMYKWVDDVNKFFNYYGTSDFVDLVKKGTPLPKKHGRLIDANEVIKIANKTKDLHGAIWNATSIIEADKAESEDV